MIKNFLIKTVLAVQDVTFTVEPLESPLGVENFPDLLANIAGWLMAISIPIATIMIVVGAFQILTAAGDPEKFKTGKKTILYAVVGLVIVLLSWGVTGIIRQILGA